MSKNRFSNNAWDEITVASYNIHQCLGTDNRKDLERTTRVIEEMDAQLIGLQEVHSTFIQSPQVDTLTQDTGLTVIPGPTMHRSDGHYGNVLLTAYSPLSVRPIDLSFPGREPRGAIDAELHIQGRSVRVIVTHLGLNARERQFQVDQLADRLLPQKHDLLVLMGDFNEWFPFRRQFLLLNRVARQNINSTNLPLSLSYLRPGPDLGPTQGNIAIHKNSPEFFSPNRLGPSAPEGEDRNRPARITHFGKQDEYRYGKRENFHFFKIFNTGRCNQMACACYLAVFRDVFGFIRDGLAISCQYLKFDKG